MRENFAVVICRNQNLLTIRGSAQNPCDIKMYEKRDARFGFRGFKVVYWDTLREPKAWKLEVAFNSPKLESVDIKSGITYYHDIEFSVSRFKL